MECPNKDQGGIKSVTLIPLEVMKTSETVIEAINNVRSIPLCIDCGNGNDICSCRKPRAEYGF